jgi:DeoR family transcriptional regulator, aga operon transcriptional repressor
MKKNNTVERRLHIMKMLEKDETVDVNSLSAFFKVSEVTIRKDLRYFEKKNMLIRSRGGALKQALMDTDMSIYERRNKNSKQKQKIGAMAASLVQKGETILLDSGTTIMEIVKHLPKNTEITVITNAVDIAFRLAELPSVKVIMPGGLLRRNSLSLVGEQAANELRNYYCDKCFIGADGIDIEKGLLTMNIEEAHLSRINIENSKQVIALIDSSKFQRKGMMAIVPLSKVDTIITDEGITDQCYKNLKELNIEVMVTGKS